MTDKIEKVSKSVIHHGKISNRIYVMEYNETDSHEEFVENLLKILEKNSYTKIFAKIPSFCQLYFLIKGFRIEAVIPDFFNNSSDGVFVSFFSDGRDVIDNTDDFIVFSKLLSSGKSLKKNSDMEINILTEKDAGDLAKLYGRIFAKYPFPVFEKKYIVKTMKENIRYFGCFMSGKLVGASSAEIYNKHKNCEMTDFAVLPELRGKGAGYSLLSYMEKYIHEHYGIICMYTIARLKEPAMNKVFINAGYRYGGTLINNTAISTGIESMNVFYKHY